MNVVIYESLKAGKVHARVRLSNECCESRYGLPVLLASVNGGDETAYGWSDILPSGLSGAQFVRLIAQGYPTDRSEKTPEREEALRAALENIEAMHERTAPYES